MRGVGGPIAGVAWGVSYEVPRGRGRGVGMGDWEVHCARWAGRACVLDGGGMSRGRGEGMQWEGCGVIVHGAWSALWPGGIGFPLTIAIATLLCSKGTSVALSSAQLERARIATGRYLLGRKSRQNACLFGRMAGEEEREADKPLRPPGYAGGRDV